MAVLAQRHDEFLERGGRIYGISADTPGQNSAVMEKLALPFPILSDVDRSGGIIPLGLADEDNPRMIARTGAIIISPDGDEVFRYIGRDYADRPDEDVLLAEIGDLALLPTRQGPPAIGAPEPGESAMPYEGIPYYFRGAKFAVLALRGRYRGVSDELMDDTKAYIRMVERYMGALPAVDDRKA